MDLTSLGEREFADADAVIIRKQIGTLTRIDIGAREDVRMRDGLMFHFGPSSRAKYRKIIVKLNFRDLYEVEVGYLSRPDFNWVIVEQVSNVDAEALSDVVRRLAARGLDA